MRPRTGSLPGRVGLVLNQPIEVPELRLRFAELVGLDHEPQLLLRLSYGQVRPTPRRPASEVLISSQ
jgi:hypothetical protein